ncbi:glycine--tRNA ligase subunit beta [Synechococcus sp. CS-1324]|uniref:glycine--tRNA ligase subunit beta n=1 Tax=Synechococcus sp. CS-1324 TaxID=2847980 RepID=UPI000DB44626|nr:glycine--tRNA ligase subunit beta [Synechococcus sp. CS-1324]MCT0230797.1 glycine--tRNA ligase subunit beta [Synechococcus sp. CS-1324]PZV03724.1 MAG: glycine--tRNA ligase subunit beta [Cyanobium sp.]
MATFLLEIGTEELPADFVRLALPQLERQVRASLSSQRLGHGLVRSTGTPRRLAITVAALPSHQQDLEEDRKGPPAGAAFADGAPTPSAHGFARRCGVAIGDLEIRQTAKGPFVFARTRQAGQSTAAVLAGEIPGWVNALQGRRFMRWGEGEQRFSRPVRWLVALLDEQPIPIELPGCDPVVRSGRLSRGHRLSRAVVTIPAAAAYAETLAAAGVQVEREDRARWIREAVETAASTCSARPDFPTELFEELVDLVESPSLIEGRVEERFLALPLEVLSTVMRTHQRYIPLLHAKAPDDPLALDATETLLPRFLCIGNGRPEAIETIRRGNERVLRARLADAEFFLAADRAVTSEQRREQLASVTFAEGLGSLLDRAERLEWLSGLLLDQLNLPESSALSARRAAHLCKNDLVSQMVGEFPELQGVMGAKYALAEGEARPVALAVLEHYLPRGAADQLPSSDAGAIVALAERLELLLSVYAKGERPSGSSDPYALRRAGNGLVQILLERGWALDLSTVLQDGTAHWQQQLPELSLDAAALATELTDVVRLRLINLLEEQGFDTDLVQAVAGDRAAAGRLVADVADVRRRVELLAELRSTGALAPLQAVVQRASRLAEKGSLDTTILDPMAVVNPALFSSASEQGMLRVLKDLLPITADQAEDRYRTLATELIGGAPALAAFFDGDTSVMVMADDPAVRTNRLNLLGVLRNQSLVLADFSRLAS